MNLIDFCYYQKSYFKQLKFKKMLKPPVLAIFIKVVTVLVVIIKNFNMIEFWFYLFNIIYHNFFIKQ